LVDLTLKKSICPFFLELSDTFISPLNSVYSIGMLARGHSGSCSCIIAPVYIFGDSHYSNLLCRQTLASNTFVEKTRDACPSIAHAQFVGDWLSFRSVITSQFTQCTVYNEQYTHRSIRLTEFVTMLISKAIIVGSNYDLISLHTRRIEFRKFELYKLE